MNGSRWYATLITLTLCTTGACASNDTSNGSGGGTGGAVMLSTGLPADKALSSFDDADAQQACQALSDGASRFISQTELLQAQCASYAIGETVMLNSDGTSVTVNTNECEMIAKACEADPESVGVVVEGAVEESDCSTASAGPSVQTCEATVAEYEACANALVTNAKMALATFTCPNAKALIEGDGPPAINAEELPACQPFLSKCPDVELTVGTGG